MTYSKQVSIIHVDDNPGSLEAFKEAITRFPGIQYLQGFTDPEKALEFVNEHAVNIVFLDVEMPGKDGIWLADKLKEKEIAIVFLTSHTQYAIHAFEACALDYIVKPADDSSISKMIRKYGVFRHGAENFQKEQISELQERYEQPSKVPQRIFVNIVGQTRIVKLEEVLYFMANANYTIIVMKDGSRLTTSKTIKKYDEAIAGHPDFLRIHRSYIVNKNSVSSIIKKGKQHRFFVEMCNNDRLEISYVRKDEILDQLVN
jgi:two-component system, LytTR family, response regulator